MNLLERIFPGRYFNSPFVRPEDKMNAVIYREHGASNSMICEQVSCPLRRDDQVLVKILSTGVNPIDVKLRKHPISTLIRPLPKIPGTDIAGIVVGCSSDCEFEIGQRVFAMMPLLFWTFGASAEYACVPTSLLCPIPLGVSMPEAAALPLVSLTVIEGFDSVLTAMNGDINALRGSKILVTAGSGGVGSVAVQYAKHVLGASVVASTCRGSKAEAVRALGADIVIDFSDPSQPQLEDLVQDFDVVFDTLAYVYMDRILAPASRILRRDGQGHYVHVGGSQTSMNPGDPGTDALGMSVPEARVDKLLGHYWRQGTSWLGGLLSSSGTPRYHVVFVRPSGELLRRVKGYVEAGQLRAVVGTVVEGLSCLPAAHDQVERGGGAVGKIVVQVCPE